MKSIFKKRKVETNAIEVPKGPAIVKHHNSESAFTASSGRDLFEKQDQIIDTDEKRIEINLGLMKIRTTTKISNSKLKRGLTRAIVNVSNKNKYYRKMKKDTEELHRTFMLKQKIQNMIDFVVNILSNVMNLCAVFLYIIQTSIDEESDNYLELIGLILSFYFLGEYIFLFFNSSNKKAYILKPMTVVEILTIIPPIVSYYVQSKTLPFLGVFRIFRVFRMLRIYKSISLIMSIRAQNQDEDLLVYNPINMQIIHSIIVLACNIFICAGLVIIINDLLPNSFGSKDLKMTFIEAFYFIIITSTTIGFGDVTPTNPISRVFTIFLLFYMVVVVGNQISKIAELILIWGDGVFIYRKTNHIVVFCDSTIDIHLFMTEIRKDYNNVEVVIVSSDKNNICKSQAYPFNKTNFVYCEEVTFDIINRINTTKAKVVFLFGGKHIFRNSISDKLLDLIIMKINKQSDQISIYTQTLFNEKVLTNDNPNFASSKNSITRSMKKSTKVIPIMKLKCMMLTKSYYNPGFLTFAQNLIMSGSDSSISQYWPNQILIKAYLQGMDNRIQIEPIPVFFVGKEFYDSVYNIYFRSIKSIFTKVKTVNSLVPGENWPILLIGVVNKREAKEDDLYLLNPAQLIIKHGMLGIFICSSKNPDYLKNFLDHFYKFKTDNLEQEDELYDPQLVRRKGQSFYSPRKSAFIEATNKENQILKKKFERGEKKATKKVSFKDLSSIKTRTTDELKNKPKSQTEKLSSKIFEELTNDMNKLTNANLGFLQEVTEEVGQRNGIPSSILKTVSPVKSKKVTKTSIYELKFDRIDEIEEEKKETKVFPTKLRFFDPKSSPIKRIIAKTDELEFNNQIPRRNTIEMNDLTCINLRNRKFFIPVNIKRGNSFAEKTESFKSKRLSSPSSSSPEDQINYRNTVSKENLSQVPPELKFDNVLLEAEAEERRTGTLLNLEMMDKLDFKSRFDFSRLIYQNCLKIFINTYFDTDEMNLEQNIFYESRIIKLDSNPQINISNHFIIIGKQEGLARIIKMVSNTYISKQICLFLSPEENDGTIIKLLKAFRHLLVLLGEYENPYHLLCLNINEATMVLFLTEKVDPIANEDLKKVLSYKAIDYFFDAPFILELWSRKSVKWAGYQPLDRNANVISNEFLHPMYMSGKLIYVDIFDKLPAVYYTYEYEYEVWSRLMSLGYTSTNSSYGFEPKIKDQKKSSFPVIISFELPSYYDYKDYHELVSDLLALDDPAIPLGLFIEQPLLYMTIKSEGGVSVDELNEIGIITSTKKKIKNMNQLNDLQKKYLKSLKLLGKISYTSKIVMDAVDLERTYLPLFITNPSPDFKLIGKIQVQVLCNFEIKTDDSDFKQALSEVRSKRLRKSLLPTMKNRVPHNLISSSEMKTSKKREKEMRRFNIMKSEDKMEQLITILRKTTHSHSLKAYEVMEQDFD